MFGLTCSIVTTVVGAVLVVAVSIIGYVAVPGIIINMVENEVVLIEDTLQFERFEAVPFPLNFTVHLWNITNPDEVLAGGVPIVNQVGPYTYKMYQRRIVHNLEEDLVHYRIIFNMEFDSVYSYPNTEDDIVTVTNVAYHAILQVAEAMFPALMPALAAGLNSVFGAANNRPIIDMRVGDLLFDGIKLCESPGLIGAIVCSQIRDISASTNNMEIQEDGSILFSLLNYRDNTLSGEYTVNRGLVDSAEFGIIKLFEGMPNFSYWQDGEEGRGSGVCNMVNGTDSTVFPPFIDRDRSVYAINTDICRSVELRYNYDTEYEGIPVARFTADEWFLDNDDGCFCLNVTGGVTREDGCLFRGAMELYTCVGAFLVLSYPHFLYADSVYRNGVIGVNPIEDDHRIFLDLEPTSGTVVRGNKRAQFNIFMRPVSGVSATENLRPTLTPIIWVTEGMSLPEEFTDELKTKLLAPLNLVSILIPVLLAVSALVLILGLIFLIRTKLRSSSGPLSSTPTPRTTEIKTSE